MASVFVIRYYFNPNCCTFAVVVLVSADGAVCTAWFSMQCGT